MSPVESKPETDIQAVTVWAVVPDETTITVFSDEPSAIATWKDGTPDSSSVRPFTIEIPVRVRASAHGKEIARLKAALNAQKPALDAAMARIADLEQKLKDASQKLAPPPVEPEREAPAPSTGKFDRNAPVERQIVARARLAGARGYHAEYGLPGLRVGLIMHQDQPAFYPTEEAAVNEARRVAIESFNSRHRFSSKREISHKLTASEFATELGRLGFAPWEWSMLVGNKQAIVVDWTMGVQEVPFYNRGLLDWASEKGKDYVMKFITPHITLKPGLNEGKEGQQK